jgi:uncharacterized protein (DUF433 family)
MENINLDQFIEITPGILGGKPRVAGHRISVAMIACWHHELGQSTEEIAVTYNLSLAQVHAALAYYYSHREEIDRATRESDAQLEELKKLYPSRLQAKLKQLKIIENE